jgi:transposase
METERIALSQRERDRLKVLHEVEQKHLSQVEAAERLKVTDRQVRRMLLRIRDRGDGALVHGLRGRPSNRKLADRLEQKILARLRQRHSCSACGERCSCVTHRKKARNTPRPAGNATSDQRSSARSLELFAPDPRRNSLYVVANFADGPAAKRWRA